jgi:hypothetical protein
LGLTTPEEWPNINAYSSLPKAKSLTRNFIINAINTFKMLKKECREYKTGKNIKANENRRR